MRLLYIYRNHIFGFSLERVFRPIENHIYKIDDITVDSVHMPSKRAYPHCLLYDCLFFAYKILSTHYDIVHITGGNHHLLYMKWLCILRRTKMVLTVHDVGFFDKNSKSLLNTWHFYVSVFSIRFSDHVTFISNFSKDETQNIIKLPNDKVSVIPDPYDPSFAYSEHVFNRVCPIILHVGTHPRKNIENTAKALRGLICEMRIVGKLTDSQMASLKDNNINYTVTYDLSDEDLLEEYKRCDIVNFPSFYEGFGLPIIEAQAIGRPVLTSDMPPMNEIAGKKGVLVNPSDPDSILDGYKRIFENYVTIVEEGLDNVTRYSVDSVANMYLRLYNELFNEKKV